MHKEKKGGGTKKCFYKVNNTTVNLKSSSDKVMLLNTAVSLRLLLR